MTVCRIGGFVSEKGWKSEMSEFFGKEQNRDLSVECQSMHNSISAISIASILGINQEQRWTESLDSFAFEIVHPVPPPSQPSLDYGGSEDRNRAKQNDRGDNPKKKLVSRTRGIVHPIACSKNKIDLWFFYDNSLYSFQNP